VADALRADALSCYGGPARTPRICELAERGVLFEQAWAGGPWTAPSAVALFTGSHASAFADDPPAAPARVFHVGDEHETLAEALAARGYAVAADVDNFLAHRANALQGLTPLDPRSQGAGGAAAALPPPARDDDRVQRMYASVDFLLSAPAPFFAVRWIFDPHAPYEPPARWLEALAPAAASLPRPLSFYASLGHENAAARLRRHAKAMAEPERALLRALYHAEVESVDERVGWLLDALGRRGLRERTLVVLTADHGEAFGEHGVWLHGKALYEELLRVPLLVAGPGVAAGRRVAQPVSLADVAPSLRELLGLPPGDEQGASFAALLRPGPGAPAGAERAAYAGSPNGTAHGVDALRVGALKLIAHADGRAELYDLGADSGETRDLAAERPQDVARLRARLEALRAENEGRRRARLAARASGDRERVREETRRELEALGYVEGGADAAAAARRAEPAPEEAR